MAFEYARAFCKLFYKSRDVSTLLWEGKAAILTTELEVAF
jgi:hypothetical protein